jgi:DNA-dependent RNA polymerase auxiliary subunit epsilon
MTQALYAHMNNKTIKRNKLSKKKENISFVSFLELCQTHGTLYVP